jgi:hypothetical protein
MTKQIMIRVSEREFSDIEKLVNKGCNRSKADFVKTATVLRIEKIKEIKKEE